MPRSRSLFYRSYFIIALAPVALQGVVLLALCVRTRAVVLDGLFDQIGNIAGAAGDFMWYGALPQCHRTFLLRDAGVDMTVYSRGRKYRLNDICGGASACFT